MKHCDTEHQFIMSFSFIQSKAKPFQFHLVLLCKICEIGHVIFLPISTQRISLEIIILSVTEPFTVANYYEIQNTEYPPSLRIDCMSYLTEGNHCRFAEVPLQDIPHITGTDPTTLSVVWTSLATCHVSRVHRCHEHVSQLSHLPKPSHSHVNTCMPQMPHTALIFNLQSTYFTVRLYVYKKSFPNLISKLVVHRYFNVLHAFCCQQHLSVLVLQS